MFANLDEDDLIRRSDIFRDLLIKRILFGYALATVVSFLSMDQMMMEIERIVRSHLVFVCRTTSTEVLINMGGVVVDDDNHTGRLGRFFHMLTRSGFLQEFTKPRNFLNAISSQSRSDERPGKTRSLSSRRNGSQGSADCYFSGAAPCKGIVIPNATHFIFLSREEEVISQINDFVNSLAATR